MAFVKNNPEQSTLILQKVPAFVVFLISTRN